MDAASKQHVEKLKYVWVVFISDARQTRFTNW